MELEEEKIRKESVAISVITDRDESQRQRPRPSFIFNENLGRCCLTRKKNMISENARVIT